MKKVTGLDISKKISLTQQRNKRKESKKIKEKAKIIAATIILKGQYQKNTKKCIYERMAELSCQNNYILGSLMTTENEQIIYKQENEVLTVTLISTEGKKQEFNF